MRRVLTCGYARNVPADQGERFPQVSPIESRNGVSNCGCPHDRFSYRNAVVDQCQSPFRQSTKGDRPILGPIRVWRRIAKSSYAGYWKLADFPPQEHVTPVTRGSGLEPPPEGTRPCDIRHTNPRTSTARNTHRVKSVTPIKKAQVTPRTPRTSGGNHTEGGSRYQAPSRRAKREGLELSK